MKKACLLLVLYLSTTSLLNATIRRVGFIATINPVNGLDYVNFQAAHDASAIGDTIYLYPNTNGSQTYSGTLNKTVVVIGPGYFTNTYTLAGTEKANANLQIIAGLINSSTFSIDNGSAGSQFIGLNNLTLNTVDQVNPLNNITVRRCRNVYISFVNSGLCNDWTITSCFNVSMAQSAPAGGFTGNRTISNLTISNSVINAGINFNTSPTGTFANNRILNCNMISSASLGLNGASFTVQNCIFDGQSLSGVNNTTFIKNITTIAAAGNVITNTLPSTGNQYSIAMANVYVGYPTNALSGGVNTYTNDGRFALKAGSPALNGGFLFGTTTVTDSGIFGGTGGTGTSPYILAGIPPIPTLYRLDAPSAVMPNGGNYTITLSIKDNN
ncbi:MAG: hypothetical protein V4722_24800 [Bacteroidota bacterium]